MEIKTTLVTFRFPKAGMEIKSNDSQLFIVGTPTSEVQEWIPKRKILIKPDPTDRNYNLVTMPKWLWLKTKLPAFFSPEETVHTEEVTEIN